MKKRLIIAKKKNKYPKEEMEPYNPFAVCNKSTGGKKKNPEKFERCVQDVKKQNKKDNKKKKASIIIETRGKALDALDAGLREFHKKKEEGWSPLSDAEFKARLEKARGDCQNSTGIPKSILRDKDKNLEEDEETQRKRQKARMNLEMRKRLGLFGRGHISSSERIIITAKGKNKEKWIQDAVDKKDEGSFTDYCGGKVTQECINKGKKSPNKKTRQRANLADTFRHMSKKKKKK